MSALLSLEEASWLMRRRQKFTLEPMGRCSATGSNMNGSETMNFTLSPMCLYSGRSTCRDITDSPTFRPWTTITSEYSPPLTRCMRVGVASSGSLVRSEIFITDPSELSILKGIPCRDVNVFLSSSKPTSLRVASCPTAILRFRVWKSMDSNALTITSANELFSTVALLSLSEIDTHVLYGRVMDFFAPTQTASRHLEATWQSQIDEFLIRDVFESPRHAGDVRQIVSGVGVDQNTQRVGVARNCARITIPDSFEI